MGLFFVALAILGWGFGDFLIQRSVRKIGDWEALFYISLFATIVLLPFVIPALSLLTFFDWVVLVGTSVVILAAALFDFDALRVGKMSVVEPIYAMEVPITVALATLLIGEALTPVQWALVITLLIGVFLVSNKHISRIHVKTMERGVIAAILATIGMGASNFLFGFASRQTGPLMINWFTSAFMAAATLAYLLYIGDGAKVITTWRKHQKLLLLVGFVDNMAWVAYSGAALYMPIGLATGLTESYIALAALLGVFYNKERLFTHQQIGLALAVLAAILLALNSPL